MAHGDNVRRALMAAGLFVLVGGVAGCEEETPAEKIGDAIEEGGENLSDAVKDTGEKLENQ